MQQKRDLGNWTILIFIVFILLFATFETSLWPNLFNSFPPPMLWLSVVVYVSIYRRMVDGLLVIYGSSLLIHPLTMMPFGYLVLLQTLLLFSARAIKQRIFWRSHTYFALMCAICVLLFHIFHLLISLAFEDNSISSPQILSWIAEIVFLVLLSPLTYWFYSTVTPRKNSHFEDEATS